MRYACPSCKRVFYLDTETVSPCPACGTTLTAGGEDAPAAAGPPQATAETAELAGAGSWLLGEGAEAAPAAPPAAPPPPVQPAPQPSATSWLSEQATPQAPAGQTGPPPAPPRAPEPTARPPISDEMATIGVATNPTQRAGRAGVKATQPFAQRGARAGATRGPSGSRLFVLTGAAVLLVGGIAVVLIAVFKPGFVVRYVERSPSLEAAEAKISKLTAERDKLTDELAKAERAGLNAKEEHNKIKLERDRLGDKITKLEGGLADRADAAKLTLEAVRLLERRADLAKALRKTDEALRADPDFLLAQRVRAQVLAASRSGLAKQALVAFERADQAARKAGGTGDAEALVQAGEVCLTDLADREKALKQYRRAAASKKVTPFSLTAQARIYQLEGDLAKAAAKAEEAKKASPYLALAPLVLGEVALRRALAAPTGERKGLIERADQLLAQAVKLDPASARASLMRGKVLLEKARLQAPGFRMTRLKPLSDAERCLETARRLKPRLAEVHEALAELRLAESLFRDPSVAALRAKEAVDLTGGTRAGPFALLAAAQSAGGSPADAVGTIDKAIKIDPRNRKYRAAKVRYEREAKAVQRR